MIDVVCGSCVGAMGISSASDAVVEVAVYGTAAIAARLLTLEEELGPDTGRMSAESVLLPRS